MVINLAVWGETRFAAEVISLPFIVKKCSAIQTAETVLHHRLARTA
jgi:hypothetical protein